VKTTAFVFSVFLLGSALASSTGSQAFTGVIGDSMCVRDHAAMRISPKDKCVRDCVKHSSDVKYILLTKDKHYILSDQAAPEKFAGQKVTVKGILYAKTGIIKVESIEAAA
jgi:predicted ATP-grasp superfamily ATP-dependent carboligase